MRWMETCNLGNEISKTVNRDCLLCNIQWIEHGIRAKHLKTIEMVRMAGIAGICPIFVTILQHGMMV